MGLTKRTSRQCMLPCVFWGTLTVIHLSHSIGLGDSAIPLLSGFDAQRIEQVYPPTNDEATSELAKLIYRLQKIAPNTLASRAGVASELGDLRVIDAELLRVSEIQVPERITEFVEIYRLQDLLCRIDGAEVRLITTNLPHDAKIGDRLQGVGVVIEANPDAGESDVPVALVAARLRWLPKNPTSVGWKLLSEAGVDISLVSEAGLRDRQPLLAEDGDAFYSLLAAAASLKSRGPLPSAKRIQPVDLLQNSEQQSGQWIHMNLETVQVTRVAVTEPYRQAQLGADHYYQVDAMGDLGNVVVRIESPQGENEPATFKNRYPVSMVTRELPEFLQDRIRAQEGGDAVVANLQNLVAVDAFFYRLWSYSTDFMKQHGGGEQFGPLLVAARFSDRESTEPDPVGTGLIGWIAAIGLLGGILAIWAWNHQMAVRDRQVREKRQSKESERLQLPS